MYDYLIEDKFNNFLNAAKSPKIKSYIVACWESYIARKSFL